MENIIKKAIEGGWKCYGDIPVYDYLVGKWFITDGDGGYLLPSEKEFVLDPLFWQALGKACGWGTTNDFWGKPQSQHGQNGIIHAQMPEWEFLGLRFHEINLRNGWKEAVSYLSNLVGKGE